MGAMSAAKAGMAEPLEPSRAEVSTHSVLEARVEVTTMTKPGFLGDPVVRTLLISLGGGAVTGLLVACAIMAAFRAAASGLMPIATIAGVGAALIVSTFIYQFRR